MVFATVYNVDEKVKQLESKTVYFDTDNQFVICDNAANTHICNDKRMFINLTDEVNPSTVATIAGKNSLPKGIGTVKWTWLDDDGRQHEYELKDVYYFPQSPVNILSVTTFANDLKDEEGTGIDTKAKYSRFYWKNNTYSRTFHHSKLNLPEMPINNGNNAFAWFINRFKRQCNDDIDQFCCLTNHQLNIIEYDDDEIDKQPQPTTFLESIIYPSENMIYKNQGKNAQVKVQSSKMDDDGVLRFQVEFPNGTTESTTCEHLHRPEQPEVANIPVSTQDY